MLNTVHVSFHSRPEAGTVIPYLEKTEQRFWEVKEKELCLDQTESRPWALSPLAGCFSVLIQSSWVIDSMLLLLWGFHFPIARVILLGTGEQNWAQAVLSPLCPVSALHCFLQQWMVLASFSSWPQQSSESPLHCPWFLVLSYRSGALSRSGACTLCISASQLHRWPTSEFLSLAIFALFWVSLCDDTAKNLFESPSLYFTSCVIWNLESGPSVFWTLWILPPHGQRFPYLTVYQNNLRRLLKIQIPGVCSRGADSQGQRNLEIHVVFASEAAHAWTSTGKLLLLCTHLSMSNLHLVGHQELEKLMVVISWSSNYFYSLASSLRIL